MKGKREARRLAGFVLVGWRLVANPGGEQCAEYAVSA